MHSKVNSCLLLYLVMKVEVTQSCSTLSESPWNSPGQNTGMGSLSLLQGIFPTQGSNSRLLHCRQILYQLSHKGSPTILECVAYPFSSRSSRPRNQTKVSCITGGFFTNWAIREAFIWEYQITVLKIKKFQHLLSFETFSHFLPQSSGDYISWFCYTLLLF